MTLIIGLANPQQVVLISDRRISRGNEILEDESNKAATFVCQDARLAVAYTGLSQAGNTPTRLWLLDALLESSGPDHLMWPTIERFRDRATRDFGRITEYTEETKRLSVVLAGYWYNEGPPHCYHVLVSNFEGFDDQQPRLAKASDRFAIHCTPEPSHSQKPFTLVTASGVYKAFEKQAAWAQSLQTLVRENRPPQAIVDKGVEIIRQLAEDPASQNTIGKQCTSIVLPSNPEARPSAQYHSSEIARQIYMPSLVHAVGGEHGAYIIESPYIRAEDSAGHPLILDVPRAGRNHPCPCRSGKKYKNCHGRPGDEPTFVFGS